MPTYDTPIGQVRLLIADVDEASQILTNDHIVGYLAMHGVAREVAVGADAVPVRAGAVRRAAADALDAIATSEALVSKVIRTQDLSTDGTKVAAALRTQAATLRAQADTEIVDAEDAAAVFGAIEFSPYPTGGRGEAAEYGWW